MDDQAARERIGAVEQLLDRLERSSTDDAAAGLETVALVLELYGEGLARVLDRVGGEALRELTEDELVAHLLLLHGLHPLAVEERVRMALEEVRPYLESHGGGVQLLAVEEGVARLRLRGSCSGCPSSTMTLKLAVEDAIHKAAPEIERVEAENAHGAAAAPAAGNGLIQLEVTAAARSEATEPLGSQPVAGTRWMPAGGLPQLRSTGTLIQRVAGEPLLFVRADGQLYAYRPHCPACAASLEGAALDGVVLACPSCGARFDARRAGRSQDSPDLHLEPVPLLEGQEGLVKVAVG